MSGLGENEGEPPMKKQRSDSTEGPNSNLGTISKPTGTPGASGFTMEETTGF